MKAGTAVVRMAFCLAIIFLTVQPAPYHAAASPASNALPAPVKQATVPAKAPGALPSPGRGGPRPTIQLSQSHGYAGQALQVSGRGQAPYPGVRLAWAISGATRTAAVVDLQPTGQYSATLKVPFDAAVGPAKVCAAVTQTELAEFACSAFTIDAPPPGGLHGRIPLPHSAAAGKAPETMDADFILVDRSGKMAASASISQDGAFTLTTVTPGEYTGIVSGTAATLLNEVHVTVSPGLDGQLTAEEFQPVDIGSICQGQGIMTAFVEASPTGLSLGSDTLGVYIGKHGDHVVSLQLSLDASHFLQTLERHVSGALFVITGPGNNPGISYYALSRSWPYSAVFDVGQLTPGEYTLTVRAVDQYGSTACTLPKKYKIEVIDNPFYSATAFFKPESIYMYYTYGPGNQYSFTGTIPNIPFLPVNFPADPTEILGINIQSSADAGIYFEGTLDLDGYLRMTNVHGGATLDISFYRVLHKSTDNLADPNLAWNLLNPSDSYYSFSQNLPIDGFEIPIFSYTYGIKYIGEVSVSVSFGMRGGVYVEGKIYPLRPSLWISIMPYMEAYIKFAISIEVLFGLVDGEAALEPGIGIGIPVVISTWPSAYAEVQDPCVFIRLLLHWYGCIFWGAICDSGTEQLAKWDSPEGCAPPAMQRLEASTPLSLIPSPAIASGPGGRMLATYIENTGSSAITPTAQVMASFWNTQSSAWGPPAPLTDGASAVHDPAAAFVGPDGQALVAWMQNSLTPQQYLSSGQDMTYGMAHQEIYFARWNGASWSAPVRLTQDVVPDGRPSLAGDAQGATLAWTRDTDGNQMTHADWQIAVRDWVLASQTWGPLELLDASTVISPTTAAPAVQAAPEQAQIPQAATFTVNSRLDGVDIYPGDGKCSTAYVGGKCTLRAAIQEANALAGPEIINLPSGVYTLTLAGRNEDKSTTGDLDILPGNLILQKTGSEEAVIDGNQLDSVFQVMPGAVVTMTGLSILGGKGVGAAGAIQNGGTLILQDCNIESNTSDSDGGGFWNQGFLELRNSLVAKNSAAGSGGGIYNASGRLALIGASLYANQARNQKGGGIAVKAGSLFIRNGSLYSNQAQTDGGGIWSSSTVTLTNTTLSGNQAGGAGGGIRQESGTSRLNNVTIAFNHSASGGGVSVAPRGGDFKLQNSILGNNQAGANPLDCEGSLDSQGYNLVQNPALGSLAGRTKGNLTGLDPRLVPLQSYNGSTLVHGLQADSPAYNTGETFQPGSGGTACEAADQRGLPRPQGPRCDMGAFERQSGPGVMNYMVSAARNNGRTALAWVTDKDGNFTTAADRRIAIAQKYYNGWSITVPDTLPAGADSPSLTIDPVEYMELAFLVRRIGGNPKGTDIGLGNQADLWTAEYIYVGGRDDWQTGPLLDAAGKSVHAEKPRLSSIYKGESLLVFRRFEARASNADLGQLAMTRHIFGTARFNSPIYLTDEASQFLQPAMEINQASGKVVVLSERRPNIAPHAAESGLGRPPLQPATQQARPELSRMALTQSDNPLESFTLAAGADPALDPRLKLSKTHAIQGSTVVISATLRNVGRDPASGLSVNLYAGTFPTGTFQAKVTVPTSPGFNEVYTATFRVTAGAGLQPFYALVTTTGSNLNTGNDLAAANLGELPPAQMVSARVDPLNPNHLLVTWQPSSVEEVGGYRILRSEAKGGPYELVGEVEGRVYTDTLIVSGRPYYYVVQAFDANGLLSIKSQEASTVTSGRHLYIPAIQR